MRLKKNRSAAEEEITHLLNQGHHVFNQIRADYQEKRAAGTFDPQRDNQQYRNILRTWTDQVVTALIDIFPTELEANSFLNAPPVNSTYFHGENVDFGGIRNRLADMLSALERVLQSSLDRYTDLPIGARLYIEDIDSFRKVRDINPSMVNRFLRDGYLPELEDNIQRHLEAMLGVPFHKGDWSGELSDLYTANIEVYGRRVVTAFLLKGRGLVKPELHISDCGKNGDQLVRLFDSPAELFVVQFVGRISDMVIKDVVERSNRDERLDDLHGI